MGDLSTARGLQVVVGRVEFESVVGPAETLAGIHERGAGWWLEREGVICDRHIEVDVVDLADRERLALEQRLATEDESALPVHHQRIPIGAGAEVEKRRGGKETKRLMRLTL